MVKAGGHSGPPCAMLTPITKAALGAEVSSEIGATVRGSAARDREDEDATTRFFLKAGMAGAALTLAQGPVRAQVDAKSRCEGLRRQGYRQADLSVVVIGTDGSEELLDDVVDKYLAAHADVWHFMPNLAKFSQVPEFLDKNRKIVLAKTTGDILAAKRAGKVAMVVGWRGQRRADRWQWQRLWSSNPPKTKLREYYELGAHRQSHLSTFEPVRRGGHARPRRSL